MRLARLDTRQQRATPDLELDLGSQWRELGLGSQWRDRLPELLPEQIQLFLQLTACHRSRHIGYVRHHDTSAPSTSGPRKSAATTHRSPCPSTPSPPSRLREARSSAGPLRPGSVPARTVSWTRSTAFGRGADGSAGVGEQHRLDGSDLWVRHRHRRRGHGGHPGRRHPARCPRRRKGSALF
jgi:hypothetical protein